MERKKKINQTKEKRKKAKNRPNQRKKKKKKINQTKEKRKKAKNPNKMKIKKNRKSLKELIFIISSF